LKDSARARTITHVRHQRLIAATVLSLSLLASNAQAEPLPQVELARFHGQTQPMLAKLKTLEATQVALAK